MPAVDTNVLIRLLVKDDAAQLASAHKLISDTLSASDTLYVPVTVAIELEWVLRANLKQDKASVLHSLSRLLSSANLSFQADRAVEAALRTYSRSSADFSDCLHAALAMNADELPFWTFDKAAAKLNGARLLTTS